MRWMPLFTFRNPDLKRYLWLSVPIMIGFSIVVVDEWIVKNQASYLGVGSLAYLQYGRTLMKVPIGMFGMAAGVAAYPTVSGLIATGRVVQAYALLTRAVRLMLLLTFATQVCLTIAGFEAVYLIWGLFADRFTSSDAQETATVLTFLCLGLSGWAAQTVISRGFYALESTWLPTIVGTAVAAIMVPVYVVLRRQAGAIGLAVASSTAIMVYVMLLGWLQRRRFEREAAARGANLDNSSNMLGGALRLALAAAIAAGLGLVARTFAMQWLPGLHITAILLRATLLCTFGIAAYGFLARLFVVSEVAEFEHILLRKLRLR
jgi:putative peptidoglycan lipid II flippase